MKIPVLRSAALIGFALIWLIAGTGAALAASKPASFQSPEEAVEALVAALKANDEKRLLSVFGADSSKLVGSGDAAADYEDRAKFVRAFEDGHKIDMQGDARAVLIVGKDDWPFPIPIVKKGGKWRFDAKQGENELINRRIGRNELSTIQVLLAIVDAQREYSGEDRNGDGRLEYAQRFVSLEGKTDGLYWPASEGKPESPLGALAAEASAHGYKTGSGSPYYGYRFKILTGQGKDAPGGAYSYLVNGQMIGGFAVVAWPAKYGSSGIMTFMVNQDGVVYQKNLGTDTTAIVSKLRMFNPDSTWQKAE
jgi:hypothetical protein